MNTVEYLTLGGAVIIGALAYKKTKTAQAGAGGALTPGGGSIIVDGGGFTPGNGGGGGGDVTPGDYTPPDYIPPDNTIEEDIIINDTNTDGTGSITITEDEIIIIGGAMGQDQHFIAGTEWYDYLVTHYRADQAGVLPYKNQSYTEQAVFNFYYCVKNYGTDNAVAYMGGNNKKYWAILSKYCPYTALGAAEAEYQAKIISGQTSPDLDAAYLAAQAASKALREYVKAGTYSKALYEYEHSKITQAEYNIVLKQYQDLQKAASDALSKYHSLGGSKVIY